MRTALLIAALSLVLVGPAAAKGRQGIALRSKNAVEKLYNQKGWVAPQRISAITPSKSGKSWHVAVLSGKHDVRVVTVQTSKSAFIGFNNLTTQKQALKDAKQQIKKYQPQLRVGATFTRAGLSDSGLSYYFRGSSKTERFNAYVTMKKGTLNNVSISD